MERKIRLSATNRAGKFKCVFDKPEKVIEFVKGWLKDPDIPYTLTIKE